MITFFIQYLAIYINVNLPNCKKLAKVGSKFWIRLKTPKKYCQRLILFQRWPNFAKYGHTECVLNLRAFLRSLGTGQSTLDCLVQVGKTIIQV